MHVLLVLMYKYMYDGTVAYVKIYLNSYRMLNVHVPYPPKNKPPLPFSAVDMAQTREGAYFRICAMHLEYISPHLADSL